MIIGIGVFLPAAYLLFGFFVFLALVKSGHPTPLFDWLEPPVLVFGCLPSRAVSCFAPRPEYTHYQDSIIVGPLPFSPILLVFTAFYSAYDTPPQKVSDWVLVETSGFYSSLLLPVICLAVHCANSSAFVLPCELLTVFSHSPFVTFHPPFPPLRFLSQVLCPSPFSFFFEY